jgi:hypothetical protein
MHIVVGRMASGPGLGHGGVLQIGQFHLGAAEPLFDPGAPLGGIGTGLLSTKAQQFLGVADHQAQIRHQFVFLVECHVVHAEHP